MNLPYDNDTMIAYLNEGTCPYCDKDNLKMIGGHIYRMHGVPINDIKDALGLRRDTGFCSPELSELKTSIAKNMGLGISEETKNKSQLKGFKHSDTVKKKLSLRSNKTEAKERFIKQLPKMQAKMTIAKQNMSKEEKHLLAERLQLHNKDYRARVGEEVYRKVRSDISKKYKQSIYGTKDFLPDEYYAEASTEFVKIIKQFGERNVFVTLASTLNQTYANTKRIIYASVERGLLRWTGRPWHPNGELTDKALEILNKRS